MFVAPAGSIDVAAAAGERRAVDHGEEHPKFSDYGQ